METTKRITNEELNASVDVFDQYVLIKQTMTNKKSVIQIVDSASDKDKFDFSFEVLQKGEKCERPINIGDCPLFGDYVKFSGVKVIDRDKNGMVTLVIVHENDIIGRDNEETLKNKKDEENRASSN